MWYFLAFKGMLFLYTAHKANFSGSKRNKLSQSMEVLIEHRLSCIYGSHFYLNGRQIHYFFPLILSQSIVQHKTDTGKIWSQVKEKTKYKYIIIFISSKVRMVFIQY